MSSPPPSARLWERDDALGQLAGQLREAGGGGRVVVVSGEAGIGKSSLVSEFARLSRERARVLWGSCDRLCRLTFSASVQT